MKKSRPHRLGIPVEVVPKIDALRAQGYDYKTIAKAFNVHWRIVSKAARRLEGYKDVPK